MIINQLDISSLTWRVFLRHLAVYKKNWKVSASFNFIEPLLYLSALGIGLGAYVAPIEGLPYINYLAPGLIASSAMFATCYECTYGTFIRIEFQKTYHAIISTPASIDDVIVGDMFYGAFKSVLYGTIILIVLFILGLVTSPWALLVPVAMFFSGLLFAELSMCWTGLVPNIDSFNYFFSLIITPLFLFSGVFFPLSGMPVIIQKLAWFSPLFHIVNLTRGLVLGKIEEQLLVDLTWVVVFIFIFSLFSVSLVRKLVIK